MLSHHLSGLKLKCLKSEMYYNKQSKKLFMVVCAVVMNDDIYTCIAPFFQDNLKMFFFALKITAVLQ